LTSKFRLSDIIALFSGESEPVKVKQGSIKGFSLIELLIVIAVLAIIAALAILSLASARRSAYEASAIATVRTVVTAQRAYWWSAGNGSYGSLTDLRDRALIDSSLGSGAKNGYSFTMAVSGSSFGLTANPASQLTGTRSFYADETGLIRWRLGPGATASDELLGP
jgi:type IV pilus assembly protein PilA